MDRVGTHQNLQPKRNPDVQEAEGNGKCLYHAGTQFVSRQGETSEHFVNHSLNARRGWRVPAQLVLAQIA